MAIFIKKEIYRRKDKLHRYNANEFLNPNLNSEENGNAIRVNTQRWNHYICSVTGYFVLIMILFLMAVLKNLIFNASSLDDQEKMQLKDNFIQMILNVFIPVSMYVMNSRLFQHVKNEFFP